MTRSFGLLTVSHFVVNGLLLWLGYYWLGVPESRAGTLAWSTLIALVIVLLGAWIYGSDLAYFGEGNRRVFAAWFTAVRNLLPFATAALVLLAIYWLLARWGDYSAKPAFRIASWLTLKLRTPVRPPGVLRVFNAVLWIVRWMVLPVISLPMLAQIAERGWRGFALPLFRVKKWLYWIETPVLLVCAIKAPFWLLHWVPQVKGFSAEMASFTARAATAYLLFRTAWLALAFVTASGKPPLTQRSTVVSP